MKYNVHQSKQKCKIFSAMQCLRLGFFSSSEILGVKRNGKKITYILNPYIKIEQTHHMFQIRKLKKKL